MRIYETEHTTVHAVDQQDENAGGAHHRYEVRDQDGAVLLAVSLQHGPLKECGVNGVQHVDLLAIVQHRLDSFQAGPFSSATNEVSSGFVGAAIAAEGTRTRRRTSAGVEGRNLRAAGVEE